MTALVAAGVMLAQEPPSAKRKASSKKKSAHKSTTAKAKPATTTKTPTNAAQHRSSKSSKTSKSGKTVAARRSTQQQPTPERYQEIQQALADRGYFSGPVDGKWGADSVDGLKRFQREQNLTEDGKLGSLSLIALGLGPKRPEPPADNQQR